MTTLRRDMTGVEAVVTRVETKAIQKNKRKERRC
jgi:hypothetical protein